MWLQQEGVNVDADPQAPQRKNLKATITPVRNLKLPPLAAKQKETVSTRKKIIPQRPMDGQCS
jgi:hypothetical protein